MLKFDGLSALVLAALMVGSGGVGAQNWVPLSGAGRENSVDVQRAAVVGVPKSIFARGGVIRAVVVAGGEGGWLGRAACDDVAVEGGRGGDGGEVLEVDLTLAAGQCSRGLSIEPGQGGRGAMRGGWRQAEGERGGNTTISCDGVVLVTAFGGGRRQDDVTAPLSAKGGGGGALVNTQDSVSNESLDLRNWVPQVARDGVGARLGFGSGGGGGGVSLDVTGVTVRATAVAPKTSVVRNVAAAKGGFGAGAGGGPAGFDAQAPMVLAENASRYGAGGGGAAAICRAGVAVPTDAGNGSQGMVRLKWSGS